MKDASTDIIAVSNELFCTEKIAQEFDKYFNRGCNIIKVGNLQPISILQRIVYGLLEKNSFVARDADHIVFTLLSEYSRGAATVVHMLTSLMQKSDDNSRIGFEIAKHKLKLYIAHLNLGNHSMQNALSKIDHANKRVHHHNRYITTKKEPQIIDYGHLAPSQRFKQSDIGVKKENNIHTTDMGKLNDQVSDLIIYIIIQESCIIPEICVTLGNCVMPLSCTIATKR